VQRWFKKVELFPKLNDGGGGDSANSCVDAVLVPLHLQTHWALMAIDLRAKRFYYFDSLLPSKEEAERHAIVLWRWLCDEADRRRYRGLQSQRWTVEAVAAAPRQYNGYDCGVFMLMFARSIAVGAVSPQGGLHIDAGSWDWSQADMPSIRQSIRDDLVGSRSH
jgi:Ulp1 family protease